MFKYPRFTLSTPKSILSHHFLAEADVLNSDENDSIKILYSSNRAEGRILNSERV